MRVLHGCVDTALALALARVNLKRIRSEIEYL